MLLPFRNFTIEAWQTVAVASVGMLVYLDHGGLLAVAADGL
jgi:hypothetical protein